jgi:tetratricopeptide (TPR) repeat protein
MELQLTILNAQEKYGEKKNIFFIYNFESCIYLSKTSAKDFFQKMNLIRDFFMGFNTTFVFFVTESSIKKMIQNAFDFYDWIKFTFTFVPESRDSIIQPIELRRGEELKYSNIQQKIQYLKNSIKKSSNESEKSIKLDELAGLYRQAGDYDASLERLLEALEIDEKNKNLLSMETRYNNIGQIYQAKGELDKALEFIFKTLEIVEKNNDRVNMAKTYSNIGKIYKAKGENKNAEKYFKRAKEMEKEVRDKR